MNTKTLDQVANLKRRSDHAASSIPAMARKMPGVKDAISITADLLTVVEDLAVRVAQLEAMVAGYE